MIVLVTVFAVGVASVTVSEGAVAVDVVCSLLFSTFRILLGFSDRHQFLSCSFSCISFSQSSSILSGKALQAIDLVFFTSTPLILALRESTKFSTSTMASLFSAMLFTMEQRSWLTACVVYRFCLLSIILSTSSCFSSSSKEILSLVMQSSTESN